ncbi:MAG: Glu/Leu/Phe/Val dehydrogenase [Planctomycetota bacterium]|nr:MAG: Glu/Leu/Phe/Val dehydrogenase [Planctomycetota bacterium]
MQIFEQMMRRSHEQVVYCNEESAGLRAIIAIHDTTLGPALGGVRMYPYATEEDALLDVLRLSKGMTYKASVAGLNLGGGKAVIIADPRKDKNEVLLRAFGRFVETLGGRYITAEDVGTNVADMEYVLAETSHVVGISVTQGGSGDPSPVTAYGVWKGIQATAHAKFGRDDLEGLRIAIQGLGKVGYHLARHLVQSGAQVTACDIDAARAKAVGEELGIEIVAPETIFDVPCDIFSPCAMGGVINDETLERLQCAAIAGAANNQIAEERHGRLLEEKGILYAPDFVINAGGLINVYCEMDGYNRDRALRMCDTIYDKLLEVFRIAASDDALTTHDAAQLAARRRIEAVRRLRSL